MRFCPSCGKTLFRVKQGETWHVKVIGDFDLTCVLVEELTPATVVLRAQNDCGTSASDAVRYKLADIEFVEKVP